MKNKMLLIVGAIVLLFAALYFVVNYKNEQAVEKSGNPYEKDRLNQATIDQLNDPLYQNQILPEDLEEKIENNEDVTVYFYSPVCVHCQRTTPILVPVAEELDVDVVKLNLLEFEEPWNTYDIEGTPTIIHYSNGEEVARLSGEKNEEQIREFLDIYAVQ
ncbi:thioredoxin family protein [Ornithinibacillus sp. 4-3]|uniref:Thioredoxin family protein n=1 Tax=Ornithinibacillus sp. 4-3 TaxID=3231488 RepID=A0AB39HRR3_9BACI